MQELAVSKKEFSDAIAEVFCTKPENILDFYGMAEQTGIIFVDCEQGNKHVPTFSQVIIRDPYTLEPCDTGKIGFIEVMSILADSYYDQAVLTEDLGVLVGVDDCPAGARAGISGLSRGSKKPNLAGAAIRSGSRADDHLSSHGRKVRDTGRSGL